MTTACSPVTSFLWCITLATLPGITPPGRPPESGTADSKVPSTSKAEVGRVLPHFVPNEGQWPNDIAFRLKGIGAQADFSSCGWTIVLPHSPGHSPIGRKAEGGELSNETVEPPLNNIWAYPVSFVFASSKPPTLPRSITSLPGKYNFFLGRDSARWVTDVPTFAQISYESPFEGVDLLVRGLDSSLEYDLIVHAGALLGDVEFEIVGSTALEVDKQGNLVVHTPLGNLEQARPITWQVDSSGDVFFIDCVYELRGLNRFGFSAPNRQPGMEMIIDPLLFSTLIGGGKAEEVSRMVEHSPGIVTFCGTTQGDLLTIQYPTTVGAYQTTHKPGTAAGIINWPITHHQGFSMDAFVSQIDLNDPNQDGFADLVFSTMLGSSGNDYALALDVGRGGSITVGGYLQQRSSAPANDFPTTADAVIPTYSKPSHPSGLLYAYSEGWVAQINPYAVGANQLAYSTYYGGANDDRILAVVGIGQRTIVIAGQTSSSNLPGIVAPPSPNPSFDFTLGITGSAGLITEYDGFVAQISPGSPSSTTVVSAATYVGGGVSTSAGTRDRVRALRRQPSGDLVVGGRTDSTNFPTTPGTIQPTLASANVADGFVAIFDPTLTALKFSTYLGGGDYDEVKDLHVCDYTGIITVAGDTLSGHIIGNPSTGIPGPAIPFPTTAGAFKTTINNFATTGYTTHWCYGLGGLSATFVDGFVARIDPTLPVLKWSTFFGAEEDDYISSMSVGLDGTVTISGFSKSQSLPTSPNAHDSTPGGTHLGNPVFGYFGPCYGERAGDAFVARLSVSGSSLIYGTYLGGVQDDFGSAVVFSDNSTALVAGHTWCSGFPNPDLPLGAYSPASVFPTTPNAYNGTYNDGINNRGYPLVTSTGLPNYGINGVFNLGEVFITKLGVSCHNIRWIGTSLGWCVKPLIIDVGEVPSAGSSSFIVTCINAPVQTPGNLLYSLTGPALTPSQNVTIFLDNPTFLPTQTDAGGVAHTTFSLAGYPSGTRLHFQYLFPAGPNCPPGPLVSSQAMVVVIP